MSGIAYLWMGVLTGLMALAYRSQDKDWWDNFGLFFFIGLTGAFVGRGISVLV